VGASLSLKMLYLAFASHVRASAELLSFPKDVPIEFIKSNLNQRLLADKPENTGKSQAGPD
jgi:hypothetical protein